MNHKAFTLIELLGVVAIIGILAAVGVVAYNGYTASAKASTTKSNHKIVVKEINLISLKCSISEDGGIQLKNKYNDQSSNWVPCDLPQRYFLGYIQHDITNRIGLRNSHKTNETSLKTLSSCQDMRSDGHEGGIAMVGNVSAKTITVCSCLKSSCKESANILEDTIQVE